MNFAPASIVKLLNAPLQADSKNQIDFDSAAAQFNYFNGLALHTFTNFTYQRNESVIRVPVEADLLYNINYVMFDNTNFSQKWFYGFVTKIDYVNPNMSAVHFIIDVWQTWQFSLVFHPSYILRQHSTTDAIRDNIEPEAISVPAYAYDAEEIFAPEKDDLSMVVYFSKQPTGISTIKAEWNSGAPTMQYCAIYNAGEATSPQQKFDYDRQILENNGELDLIDEVGVYYLTSFPEGSIGRNVTWCVPRSGYIPKNKKCYLYCYCYIMGSNSLKITLQDTDANYPLLSMTGKVVGGGNPFAYVHITGIPNSCIEFTSFPIASIISSTYENAVNKSLKQIEGHALMNIASQGLSSLPRGYKAAGKSMTDATLNEMLKLVNASESLEDSSLYPDNLSAYQSSTAKFDAGYGGIWCIKYAPTVETMKRIDDYFSMFGYTVNRILQPSFRNRPYWDYIETADIDISGNLPQDDLQKIKNMFNSGVTFWHNPAYFGDYTQNNAPT